MTQVQSTDSRPRWMRWAGLRRREGGKWIKFLPTKLGVMWISLVAIGGNVAFMEYSMQPDFCRSCHVMEPYYQAWHKSTHREVACVDCHFAPGLAATIKGKTEATTQLVKFLTKTYGTKPHAEVHDAACLRSGCHETRVLEGKVAWTVKSVGGHDVTINFDHTPHMTEDRRGMKLRCVSCHGQLVQGQHLTVTLDSCFLCHFKGFEHGRNDDTLGGCTACHDSPKETIRLTTGEFKHDMYVDRGVACENCHSDAMAGEGKVQRQYCWSCHNQPEAIARFGETKFLHDSHVTHHKVECTSCHERVQHHLRAALPEGDHAAPANMNLLTAGGGCASCHGGMHGGALSMYSGSGGRGVADMPSPMYRAQVDCIACHRDRTATGHSAAFAGFSYKTTQQACDYCHANDYPGRLEEWKTTIDLKLAEATAAMKAAEEALAASTLDGKPRLELQRLLDDACHNLRFVEMSRGVHNVAYATALLNVTIENSKRVTDTIRKPTTAQATR